MTRLPGDRAAEPDDDLAARRERNALEAEVRELVGATGQTAITEASIRACDDTALAMTAYMLRRLKLAQKRPFYIDGI